MKEFYTKHKDIILLIITIIAIVFSIGMLFDNNTLVDKNELLEKELIKSDTLKKVAEGKYAKLVNTYSNKQELEDELKEKNNTILQLIKKNKERVLSKTDVHLTFKNKKDTSSIVKTSDSTFNFKSYYPNKDSSFINYIGNVNIHDKIVNGEWVFSELKINLILTQRQDGLWNNYFDGPSFIKLNNMTINSLPAKKYIIPVKDKLFNIYGGLGYRTNFDKSNIILKGGIGIKNKVIFEADAGTDKTIGGGILIKLK